MGIATRNRGG